MNDLEHQRLAELSRELRLSTVPDLYSVIAQRPAAKSSSLADFWKRSCAPSVTRARPAPARCSDGVTGSLQ